MGVASAGNHEVDVSFDVSPHKPYGSILGYEFFDLGQNCLMADGSLLGDFGRPVFG